MKQMLLNRNFLSGLAIAALVAAVYGTGLDNAFQYDDLHSIVENPHIRSLGNIPAFFLEPEMFSADPRNAMYRPLVLFSYALNHAIGGYEVAGYHLFNLLVHLGNALLLYVLVLQLGGGRRPALLAGLLFALHPLAAEPVNYLSSRSESLCAFFFLLSFWGFVKGGRWWQLLSIAAFAGSLLSKSVGMALLPVLLLYDYLFRREQFTWKGIRGRHSPFWLAGLVYLVGGWRSIDTALVSHPVRPLAAQLFTQAKALVYYLKLLWMPQGLSAEHQFLISRSALDPAVLPALLLALAGAGLLVLSGRRTALFWAGWALLVLLPTLVVPLNVLVNEHRLYLPEAAFAVLMGSALNGVIEQRQIAGAAIALAWLGIYGLLDYQRTQVWHTPQDLWQDALAKAPRMPRPHLYLGDCYQQAGQHEQALREYALARTVYPAVLSGGDLLAIYNNQGAAYLAMGRHAEAVESYRQALAIDSTYARSREALDALIALQQQEWNPTAHALHKKGLLAIIAGRADEAIRALEQSLQIQARPESYLALGLACERREDWGKARWAYETLKAVAPGSDFSKTAEEKLALLREKR